MTVTANLQPTRALTRRGRFSIVEPATGHMESGPRENLASEVSALRRRLAELEGAQPEQERAEGALRESEDRSRALLECASEGIIIVDSAGRVVSVNPRAREMFGYAADELVGQPVEVLLPAAYQALHREHRARYALNPQPRPMAAGRDLVGRRKDGSEFPARIGLSFTETREGPLFMAFVSDLTERRQVEAALSHSLARADALLEAASEGVVIVDRRGRIMSVNARTEAMFGWPRQELVGQGLEVLLPERRRRVHERHVAHYFADPRVRPMGKGLDLLARRRDGREFPVEVSLSFIETEDGRQAMAFITDITERLAVEQAARQAERLAALGTMAAGIAHEINNPVGIMSSRIELMLMEAQEQQLPEALREDLRVLHRNALRVVRIAQSLLSFARESPADRQPVDLNRCVEDMLLFVERQFGKQGVRVVTRLDPTRPLVLGHANALEQVVLNLITNARDALGDHGEISIESGFVRERPGWVRLKVSDTGPGISPDVLPRVFDPFFTTKEGGTGLGLSVTYGIVRDHNGTIDVQSDQGRGTTFTLMLPQFKSPPA
jgi:PAS domain S-box-containing protein